MTDPTPNFPDFRSLCAELTVKLEYWMSAINRRPLHSVELVDRARAALATPPPEPPTDEELYDYWISTSPQFGCADPVGFARAVLERWGNH
jgi:hypothetical protein